MKINSTVFTVIAISLVAIVSYYIGVSNQSVNPDQESTTSNILPITPKQAKAVEANPEPCIPNNRVTTTLPSLPKEEVFNIPAKQTTNQPIYDKHNWPSGATGYVHTKDGGYTWIYTNPNQEQSVTGTPVRQNPTQIITDRFKKTQQYIQSQQQTELDVFRITRFRSREEAIDELNQINLKYQQLLNQEKFKSDQQISQLKRIQSLIDAGQIDSAAGNEAMWRIVFPLETNPIPNYAAEASAATEKVKRKLIATQQQQEELARQQVNEPVKSIAGQKYYSTSLLDKNRSEQSSIYRNAEPLATLRNLSETLTKVGNYGFYNGTFSDGGHISGTSSSIGNLDFHHFTTSDGQSINGTSNHIGNLDFHHFTTSNGQSINGTSNHIGNFDFHHFTTSDGQTINGSSTRIGNFTFNHFNDSAGNSMNGTTINLGSD